MKTVSIDFDGVIHAYSKGWQDGSCYDGPLPGAIEAIKKLMEGYAVFVLSTRDSFQILEWFEKHAPEIGCDIIGNERFWNAKGRLGITDRKLPAMVYIDDRGYLFRNWEETIKLADLFAEWPGANLLNDEPCSTVDAHRAANADLLRKLADAEKDAAEAAVRLHWLHDCSKRVKDDEGYEWGIYRVKWSEHGQPISVLSTNSDFSDLDEEMRRDLNGLPSGLPDDSAHGQARQEGGR